MKMYNSVNERINFILMQSNLTKKAFAEGVGMSRQQLDNIIAGGTTPQTNTILKICEAFNIRESWLLNNQGEPFEPGGIQIPESITGKKISSNDRLIDSLREQIKFLQEDLNIWRETARNLSAHLGKENGPESPAFILKKMEVSGLRA